MSADKTPKVSFFKGLSTEYKKIIFPSRHELVNHTISTIVVSIFLGAVIAVLDLAIKAGLGFLL